MITDLSTEQKTQVINLLNYSNDTIVKVDGGVDIVGLENSTFDIAVTFMDKTIGHQFDLDFNKISLTDTLDNFEGEYYIHTNDAMAKVSDLLPAVNEVFGTILETWDIIDEDLPLNLNGQPMYITIKLADSYTHYGTLSFYVNKKIVVAGDTTSDFSELVEKEVFLKSDVLNMFGDINKFKTGSYTQVTDFTLLSNIVVDINNVITIQEGGSFYISGRSYLYVIGTFSFSALIDNTTVVVNDNIIVLDEYGFLVHNFSVDLTDLTYSFKGEYLYTFTEGTPVTINRYDFVGIQDSDYEVVINSTKKATVGFGLNNNDVQWVILSDPYVPVGETYEQYKVSHIDEFGVITENIIYDQKNDTIFDIVDMANTKDFILLMIKHEIDTITHQGKSGTLDTRPMLNGVGVYDDHSDDLTNYPILPIIRIDIVPQEKPFTPLTLNKWIFTDSDGYWFTLKDVPETQSYLGLNPLQQIFVFLNHRTYQYQASASIPQLFVVDINGEIIYREDFNGKKAAAFKDMKLLSNGDLFVLYQYTNDQNEIQDAIGVIDTKTGSFKEGYFLGETKYKNLLG